MLRATHGTGWRVSERCRVPRPSGLTQDAEDGMGGDYGTRRLDRNGSNRLNDGEEEVEQEDPELPHLEPLYGP